MSQQICTNQWLAGSTLMQQNANAVLWRSDKESGIGQGLWRRETRQANHGYLCEISW